MFNKNDTKIVGNSIGGYRKSTEDIKLERINLDRQIYGISKPKDMVDKKSLLTAKRNLTK